MREPNVALAARKLQYGNQKEEATDGGNDA